MHPTIQALARRKLAATAAPATTPIEPVKPLAPVAPAAPQATPPAPAKAADYSPPPVTSPQDAVFRHAVSSFVPKGLLRDPSIPRQEKPDYRNPAAFNDVRPDVNSLIPEGSGQKYIPRFMQAGAANAAKGVGNAVDTVLPGLGTAIGALGKHIPGQVVGMLPGAEEKALTTLAGIKPGQGSDPAYAEVSRDIENELIRPGMASHYQKNLPVALEGATKQMMELNAPRAAGETDQAYSARLADAKAVSKNTTDFLNQLNQSSPEMGKEVLGKLGIKPVPGKPITETDVKLGLKNQALESMKKDAAAAVQQAAPGNQIGDFLKEHWQLLALPLGLLGMLSGNRAGQLLGALGMAFGGYHAYQAYQQVTSPEVWQQLHATNEFLKDPQNQASAPEAWGSFDAKYPGARSAIGAINSFVPSAIPAFADSQLNQLLGIQQAPQ